jgi:carbon starvation protein
MFGIANQLLASVALAVGTTIIVNMGKARYAWITAAPLAFVSVTTLTAGVLSVRDNFWPLAVGADPSLHVQGYVNTVLTITMMVCVLVILASAMWRCAQVLRGRIAIIPASV